CTTPRMMAQRAGSERGVEIADLIERREGLVPWPKPERRRRVRGLWQPCHEVRELPLFGPERRCERAVPRLAPHPDRCIEPFEPLPNLLERGLVLHRASRSVSFSTRRRATSVFFKSGSRSMPSALTKATSSSSEPNAERG